ncbi:MAG TPA: hypothetical protein VIG94_03840 [Faecalibacter sp.]
MIRNLLTFIIISINFTFSFGQNLNPNESILTMPESLFNYYTKVRNKLLKDNYKNTFLKLIVLPSFQAEYSLRVVKSNNDFYGSVTKVEENIWYAKDYENLKVEEFTSQINNHIIELLLKKSDIILSNTQYSNINNFAIDGVRFVFANQSKSGTFRTGDNFKDYKFIKILERLTENIISQNEFNLIESEIQYLNSNIK